MSHTRSILWGCLFNLKYFPGSLVCKESACSAGDPGLISGLGRFPGGGNGNPLQYSCLENPMDRGAFRATVHGVARVGHDLVTKSSLDHRKSEGIRKVSASLTVLKLLTIWITTNCAEFFKRQEYQTTLPVSWETCMWVKKLQLEPYMEQNDWFKTREGVMSRLYIVTLLL